MAGDGDFDPADFENFDQADFQRRAARAFKELGATQFLTTIEDARADAEGRSLIPIGKRLPEIALRDWIGLDPPPRVSLWGEMLPVRQTTMLTGRGGIGKSLFAQCLVTAAALGRPFLGLPTVKSRALYVTCEDDADELWRRQKAICASMDATLQQLDGWLHLVSLAGAHDTALATFDPKSGGIETTERWSELRGTVAANGIRLAVFDNATDAMAGDLNEVHQVASFVNLLTGEAISCDGVFVIVHHPNKAGDDWLGSVAWHNKVRSRLIIEGGDEGEPDARSITHPKANYGPHGGKISFRWHEGSFIADAELSAEERDRLESTARASYDNAVFIKCLQLVTKQERAVSHAHSASYAPAVFERLPNSNRIGKARLEAAMNRLLAIGAIERGELPWRKQDRHQAIGLRETAVNGAVNPAVNGAEDARSTRGKRAVNVAADTPLSKEREGAAPSGQAAPSLADEAFDPFCPDDDDDSLPGWD